jgi:hypothetical protein
MTRDHVDVLRVGMQRSVICKSISQLDLEEQIMFYMAKQYNIELFMFHMTDINADSHTINGLFLDGDNEVRRITAYPHIADNLPEWKQELALKKYPEEIKAISEHCLVFRQPMNREKSYIYETLYQDGKYKYLLIQTQQIREFADIEKYLGEYNNNAIIKPLLGSKGKMIHELWREDNDYYIKVNQQISKHNLATLEAYYMDNLDPARTVSPSTKNHGEYVIQPFIHSKTKHGNPFDIRIHARRGGDGKFHVHYYPRIGDEKGIVSNISSGGYTMEINRFLKREFGERSDYVAEELVKIGSAFPDYFQGFYENEIQAMGLDVGIQNADGNITFHLFEVNLRYPAGNFFEPKVARLNLGYYWHVFGKHEQGNF